MNGITPADMMKLQNNYFNTLAEDGLPVLLKYVNENELTSEASRYLEITKAWNIEADPASKGQTIYQCWWDSLEAIIWNDDISKSNRLLRCRSRKPQWNCCKDSTSLKYLDNINTTEVETLSDDLTSALNKAAAGLIKRKRKAN
jgi:penicillin amidase